MSTLPDTTMNTPYVPYQAYKSKRHSRNVSNQSGSPQARPQSIVGTFGNSNGHANGEPFVHHRSGSLGASDSHIRPGGSDKTSLPRPTSMIASLPHSEHPESAHFDYASYSASAPAVPLKEPPVPYMNRVSSPVSIPASPSPSSKAPSPTPSSNGTLLSSPTAGPSSLPAAGPSHGSLPTPRKTSTFRHVPLRAANVRSPLPSSPLRPVDTHARMPSNGSSMSRQLDQPRAASTPSQASSNTPSPPVTPHDRALPDIPTLDLPAKPLPPRKDSQVRAATVPPSPNSDVSASRLSSPVPQIQAVSSAPTAPYTQPSSPVTSSTSNRIASRSFAPYRPGFQPKGVYRPRTDEFVEARKARLDVGRIERTRIERRLEKLINLHFPPEEQKLREKAAQPSDRRQRPNKRLSSIFDMDFSDLRSKSASDLWRDVLQSQATPGSKNDIRSAEQTITPWEDDASVTQCFICSASFHPLTNRKHHCRLCGRIVCSLPVKYPQRPQTCSLLFVADSKTGRIEEVGEGVDYGVRRRTTSNAQSKGKANDDVLSEEEKFLKGVRICRECRPVLSRQQYKHEAHSIPVFFKLYDAFISLEKEIEDSLPQFQELMLSLSKQERPTPEATAARKRLLEAFSQYDVLAKRICQLPCPGGPGSSQDRIQGAILNRANIFLQKHMFPLQSLPKPQSNAQPTPSTHKETDEQGIDPDSEVARVLQPLLEQEALLETFVEEAKAHRKFEDAKTLKANLQEIRTEISRIVANAQDGMGERAVTRRQSSKSVPR